MTAAPPPRPTSQELLHLGAAGAGERLRRVEAAGRFYWVKREERLALRMRLQKGDPHRAFLAEREALVALSAAGLPVPPVLAADDSCFVTPDCGPTLRQILRHQLLPPRQRVAAFEAAGAGLAAFHGKGVSHGRPALRDICWDGYSVRFIDFERYRSGRNTAAGHAQDLVMLVLSAFTETGRETAETRALAAGYRAADPSGIWERAGRLCRRIGWFEPLTRPLQRAGKPEFRAIPLTLAAFG